MQKVKFNNYENIYDVSINSFFSKTNKRYKLVFKKEIPNESEISNGFVELNEYNNLVQGDFSDFKYIYKKESDTVYILTNNINDVYVSPKPHITFSANNGGTLEGKLMQETEFYNNLVIPTPIPNENYKFVKWSPEIPNSGVISESTIFIAEFEYVPTESDLKEEKIKSLNSEIQELKSQLSETDYIFIKSYEASVLGENIEDEYDYATLHTKRQFIRDKINSLELELNLLL